MLSLATTSGLRQNGCGVTTTSRVETAFSFSCGNLHDLTLHCSNLRSWDTAVGESGYTPSPRPTVCTVVEKQLHVLLSQPEFVKVQFLSWGTQATVELGFFEFSVAPRPQRPYGLSGTGSPGQRPRLSHSSCSAWVQCCFTSTETVRTVRDGEPRTATSTFTQLPNSEGLRLHWVRDEQPRSHIYALQACAHKGPIALDENIVLLVFV